MLRFGTDGVRGVALTELTVEHVAALGAAAARVLGDGTWLIGRDTRESGVVLQAALVAGLRSQGALVVTCGVVPTPALAHFSATHQAPAAMITASHNPYTDNGVKVFAAGGSKLTDDVEHQIEAQLSAGLTAAITPERIDGSIAVVAEAGAPDPAVTEMDGVVEQYVKHLVGLFAEGALDGMRVVLDCANGAMSEAAPMAVRALGATVTVVHAEPNGTNINDRCGATHPASLAAAVLAVGAQVGLAFDGDGDRVIAVDELGNVVDGDRLIAMAALQLRDDGILTDDTVVVTVMSNLGFHHAMRDAGVRVVATAVGDRYVLEALAAGGYAIGGEQSGHIIYPDIATTGDGLLAGLRLLSHLRDAGQPLSRLAAEVMTTYPQVLINVALGQRRPDIADEMSAEVAAVEALLGSEGRVLLRASGTEALVRVMVEASTDEQAVELAEQLATAVRTRFG